MKATSRGTRRRKRAPAPRRGGCRHGAGAGWLYGRHAVAAALANPSRRLHRLVATEEAARTLAEAARTRGLAPETAAAADIAALLPESAAHQGCALLADPLPPATIEAVIAAARHDEDACVVVLDQVTDPRNVGAVLRSAAAFGARAVILPDRRGAGETAALAKTASGALETVALVRATNVARTLQALKSAGFWCIGLDARAPVPIAEADLGGRVALVLGAEDRGLRRLVAETCDMRAALPIAPGVESLNVAAAAAIALYETARRRGGPAPS